ncbi:MFS transporter [Succinatimonas hippei]|uniref:MFS transporter n=1 Tax=Succinatimonas hippei TaxID=626938 RepID=UPI0023F71AE9|nr:MFS transporter [Succinatimonas hippei]
MDKERFAQSSIKSIFNRNFNVVTLVNFIVMIAYYQIFVTSAFYAQEHFDVSLSTAGSTAGIMVIGCLIGRFFTGNLLSRCGCRSVLIAGTLLYLAVALSSFISGSLFLLFIQRFVTGFGVGVIGTATGTIMAYCVPYAVQGLGVSIFSLSTALALALGPFLGISITHFLGYEILKTDIIALSTFALICAFLLKNPPEIKTASKSFLKLSNFIDVRVLKFAVVVFLMPLSYGCISAYISNLAADRGIEGAASLFFLFAAGTTIATRPISGRLFDKYGENLIIYPCIILSAIAMLLIAYTHSSFILLLAGVINGIGFGNFQSAGQAIALRLVKKYRFPQATSTFFIAFDFGIGVGPYLFGFIAVSYGFTGMFLALSAITFITAFLYYLLHGKNHPLKRPLLRRSISR